MNKILIFGGTGSLGHKLVEFYSGKNELYVASRDETKQWEMKLKYSHVNFLLCDVRDCLKVKQVICNVNPDAIIIASAMKHINVCEMDIHECIQTNILGTKNIIENLTPSVNTVCFVSTDKACNPVNAYGMSKGISESLMIQYALSDTKRKYVVVRYGNVLNSRGSIIPVLHNICTGDSKQITLTHENMTRFIMTLEESVKLIDYSIHCAESGDIVIPKLISMKVRDLLEIFSEIYKKPIVLGEMRPGEKILESLINETQAMRVVKRGDYMHIKPRQFFPDNIPIDYNSSIEQITKEELRALLTTLNLL
jgi:FlaA1/EpsC-like NDP-sugar epimerase